jgi:hypothetical protein
VPFAILPIIQAFGSGLWSFLSSRFGQIVTAFAVAWIWSGWRADDHWKAVMAAEKAQAEAAYRAEVARQERATHDIAVAATARAEDDAVLERELRAQIEAFNAQEIKNVPPARTIKQIIFRERAEPPSSRPCVIDNNFSGVVRRLDAASRRPPKSTAGARHFR